MTERLEELARAYAFAMAQSFGTLQKAQRSSSQKNLAAYLDACERREAAFKELASEAKRVGCK